MQNLREQWFGNVRSDILAGLVVALALIPEAIAFSILAGVDPMVGLYASFVIAVTISFVGGRPAMISAATGAMALVIVSLVKDHGLQYLLAATILTGVIQVLFGVFKIARLMKFIPERCDDWFCQFTCDFSIYSANAALYRWQHDDMDFLTCHNRAHLCDSLCHKRHSSTTDCRCNFIGGSHL